MKTQFDNPVRVVSLDNLEAMCKEVSGICRRYTVSKVTRSRVHVDYSNPDEWGNEHPMTAVFPCYPACPDWGDEQVAIVLEYMQIIHDSADGEGWQCFEVLRNCPPLYRNPAGEWVKAKKD
jgi:hypothetical protein